MIKAEVVFSENRIELGCFIFDEAQDGSLWFVTNSKNDERLQFVELEQAISYCLENKYE